MVKQSHRKKINIVYLVFALLLILIFAFLPISRILDNYLTEYKLTLYNIFKKNRSNNDGNIALVEIDDASAGKYSFPFSYSIYNKFLKKCKKAGVKGVAFLTIPAEDNNEKTLVKQMESGLPVFWGLYFVRNYDGNGNLKIAAPPARLLNRARGRGIVMQNTSADGVLRSKKLGVMWQGKILPSIELEIAEFLKNFPPDSINFTTDAIYMGGRRIPTNNKYEYFFIPGKKDEFVTFKFNTVMESKDLKGLQGKTLIVGRVYNDNRGNIAVPLPLNPRYNSLQTIASTVNSIVREEYIMNLPQWIDLLIMIFMAVLMSWLIPAQKMKRIVLFSLIVIFIYTVLNFALFLLGYNFSLSAVLLMTASLSGVATVYKSFQLNSIIRKFVPSQLIDTLGDNGHNIDCETRVRTVTVLFADIKGYTTLAERYNPAVVLDMLDEYTSMINKIVEKNGGLMFNYQGDGLLAIFGLNKGDNLIKGANNAVKSARLIQEALKSLRRQWRMEYRELFIIGIGISTGEVAIGLMGSSSYSQYVAIGDTVNTAARLQALGKDLRTPIVIDEDTAKLCRDRNRVQIIRDILLKGKYKSCKAYEVVGRKKKTPTTHPGISLDDDMETAVFKKMEFYREYRHSDEV